MAFFKVSTSEEKVKDYSGSGSKYINQSGIYEVIIDYVVVDVTANGSKHINLVVNYQDQQQTLFRAIPITNNDGSPNEIGQLLFNRFCIVCGAVDDNQEISDEVKMTLPIGRDNEPIDCMVLRDFENIPVYIRIQMEYGLHEGKIQTRRNVRNFFRVPDKASAMEITNNSSEIGKQYAKEEAYADAVEYKDELNKEIVDKWLEDKRANRKQEEPANKPSGGFGGGKRFGGKK